MQASTLKKAIEACGEIARGFKKLKACLSEVLDGLGNKTPVSSQSPPVSEGEEPVLRSSNSEKGILLPQPCEPTSLEVEEGTNWLFSSKCRWGPKHGTHLAEFVIGRRWRADIFKNYWKYVGPRVGLEPTEHQTDCKKNWRSCSERQIVDMYETYKMELENSKDALKNCREKKTKQWKALHGSRKGRVFNVIKSKPISMKAFVKIMRINHKEFSPLRG